MENCKVIAVTNQKGGVGKTTTAVNLGAALAKQGKSILLIDADPQGSLTVSLGIRNPDELNVALATVMQNVIEDRPFLPGDGLETALFNVMSRESVLKKYVNKVKGNYDYVLIDCMPSLGMMTINALAAADSVIIPSQPSFLSAKGMDLLFRSIAKVKRSINPDLRIDGVLMTMVDGRTNNARDVTASLRATVGQKIRIFDTEIPHSVRAAECSQMGKSIFAHDPNGKVAAAYENLAKEVIRIEERSFHRPGNEWVR